MPALSQKRGHRKVWKSLYNDDSVSALKIVLDTPRATSSTKYEMNLTDEQLKPAIRKPWNSFKRQRLYGGVEDMMRSAMKSMLTNRMIRSPAGRGRFPGTGFSFRGFPCQHGRSRKLHHKDLQPDGLIDRDNYIIKKG